MRKTLFVSIALLLCADAAHAGLGGAPATLESADTKVRARAVARASASYSVIETTLASGTIIREYVSKDGTVFAVSWNGPFVPDLKELLGDHFQTMVDETSKNPRTSRNRLTINRADVAIRRGGHMRAYRGQAWIPTALPAGFSSSDIR